jgi:7-cyano-7-deazaguanine synthase
MGLYHSALTQKDYKVPEGHYADENMKQTVVPNRNAIFSSLVYKDCPQGALFG